MSRSKAGIGRSGCGSRGPPVETIKLEAEIDATDGLEQPEQNRATAEFGIQTQLAALETLVYPTSDQLNANNNQASAGKWGGGVALTLL